MLTITLLFFAILFSNFDVKVFKYLVTKYGIKVISKFKIEVTRNNGGPEVTRNNKSVVSSL